MAALAGGQVLVALSGAGVDEAIAASNVAAPSTDGAVIPTVGSIVDRLGNVWTVKNGFVFRAARRLRTQQFITIYDMRT